MDATNHHKEHSQPQMNLAKGSPFLWQITTATKEIIRKHPLWLLIVQSHITYTNLPIENDAYKDHLGIPFMYKGMICNCQNLSCSTETQNVLENICLCSLKPNSNQASDVIRQLQYSQYQYMLGVPFSGDEKYRYPLHHLLHSIGNRHMIEEHCCKIEPISQITIV